VTVRALTGLAVVGVLLTALAACSDTSAPPDPTVARSEIRGSAGGSGAGGSGGSGGSGISGRPEFHGAQQLHLRRGHQLTLLSACVANAERHRLCQAVGTLSYAGFGRTETATLTDAVMSASPDHTLWLVELDFTPSSRRALQVSAARASRSDEFLLVLDERERVLVPLALPAIRGTTVTVGPVTKREAWRLVQLLNQG